MQIVLSNGDIPFRNKVRNLDDVLSFNKENKQVFITYQCKKMSD